MCGLALLRVAHAETSGEIVFAVALTVVEIGVIALLEWQAGALRGAYRDWASHNEEYKRFLSLLAAAESRRDEIVHSLHIVEQGINAHIAFVEDAERRSNKDALVLSARKSVADGSHAGVKENLNRVRGLRG